MNHPTVTRSVAHVGDSRRPNESADGTPAPAGSASISRDCSGFAVFSHGELGGMHVLAHHSFDNGDIASGHRALGAWLAINTGSGSDWIHLHFHMAVFELALGAWEAAYARFEREILPAAATTRLALTDAPSLLWRLEIEAPARRPLPWQALRATAEAAIAATTGPFTTLHQLLVFAGTGDEDAITNWRRAHRTGLSSVSGHVLDRAAEALGAIARRDYAAAARGLREIAPKLPRIGGSFAQNDLFLRLERWCRQQSPIEDARRPTGLAA